MLRRQRFRAGQPQHTCHQSYRTNNNSFVGEPYAILLSEQQNDELFRKQFGAICFHKDIQNPTFSGSASFAGEVSVESGQGFPLLAKHISVCLLLMYSNEWGTISIL